MESINVTIGKIQLFNLSINKPFSPIETFNETMLKYNKITFDDKYVFFDIIGSFNSTSIRDDYKLKAEIGWDLKVYPKSEVDAQSLFRATLMPLKHLDEILATIYKNQDGGRPKLKFPSFEDYKDELQAVIDQF